MFTAAEIISIYIHICIYIYICIYMHHNPVVHLQVGTGEEINLTKSLLKNLVLRMIKIQNHS